MIDITMTEINHDASSDTPKKFSGRTKIKLPDFNKKYMGLAFEYLTYEIIRGANNLLSQYCSEDKDE